MYKVCDHTTITITYVYICTMSVKTSCLVANRFFNQNIAAKDPEKKIPSTTAKAITLIPNDAV